MVFSDYKKQRIIHCYLQGYKAPTIQCFLREEKLKTSRVGIAMFITKYEETECISRLPGSGHPSKITAEIKAVVDGRMRWMTRPLHISFTLLWWLVDLTSPYERYFDVTPTWDGLFVGVLTVSSIVKPTRKSDLLGHISTSTTLLTTLFGPTNAVCSWRPTVTFVVGSAANDQSQSQGLCCLCTCKCTVYMCVYMSEKILPESQYGFRKGRSYPDMIFMIRQLVEKAVEHQAKQYIIWRPQKSI